MLIIDKKISTRVLFKDLKKGECFIDEDGELNIKLDVSRCLVKEGYPNAVSLDSGYPWDADDEYEIIKAKTKVIIED